MAGIIPTKSDNLNVVCPSPFINARRSAVLNKFSKAVILKRALTPLFASINSLSRASKTICSNKSLAKSGTITEDLSGFQLI